MKLTNLKWKSHLNITELIDFIMEISPIDEDEEYLENYFNDVVSVNLKEVELSWVKRKPDMELRDDPNVYTGLSASTAPPIIVDSNGEIEDGQHRFEAAVKRGDKKILAYVITRKPA